MKAKEQNVLKIEVLGRLLTQNMTKQNLIILSQECSATILDLSQEGTPCVYSLYITNENMNENSNWSQLSFMIQPQMGLSFFTNRDIDVFQWVAKNNIYFLEILLDESNEINKH